MKKVIIGLTTLYFSLISCEPKEQIISNSYQSNKIKTSLLLDPLEEERSFAKIYLIDKENKDTTILQTDNWGRAEYKLDTTKTYYAFIKPGYDLNGNPGDQFKPYKSKEINPKDEKLKIIQKESDLEKLAKN
jgi:hypothetical protein